MIKDLPMFSQKFLLSALIILELVVLHRKKYAHFPKLRSALNERIQFSIPIGTVL